MNSKKYFVVIKRLLAFVEDEVRKPINNNNLETLLWYKGYKKAMLIVRNLIYEILDNLDL
jgi:hypothetical protein